MCVTSATREDEVSDLPRFSRQSRESRMKDEMHVTNHAQQSGPAPNFRHRAVTSADRTRHFVLFATEISRRGHSISSNFNGIDDPDRVGFSGTQVAPQHLIMNGMG